MGLWLVIGTSVLDEVAGDHSYACFSPPLPGDVAVTLPSSLAGQCVSVNTNDVCCVVSIGTWVQSSPHAPSASGLVTPHIPVG